MFKFSKTTFQDIHYSRITPPLWLNCALNIAQFFYKTAISLKNYLYKKDLLQEHQTDAKVICIGNLTTGGVGKTPIVLSLANKISKEEPVAIISRGYKAKLNNKNPNVIKDFGNILFKDGSLCGDEPYQLAKKANKNTVIITCKDRLKAIDLAVFKFGVKTVILDDGFSNRTVKKDETILVIDSKMRFGNSKLLPLGPLREPLCEIKRADKIILVNKGDENINEAINWAKQFNKPLSVCKMQPKRIYNILTKANIKQVEKPSAVAFCAIGQPNQFYDFLAEFYEIKKTVNFSDHHLYTKTDIKNLTKLAKENNCSILITTQKDETKIKDIISEFQDHNFYALELENTFEEIN